MLHSKNLSALSDISSIIDYFAEVFIENGQLTFMQ